MTPAGHVRVIEDIFVRARQEHLPDLALKTGKYAGSATLVIVTVVFEFSIIDISAHPGQQHPGKSQILAFHFIEIVLKLKISLIAGQGIY
jgi:hypothetical protein